jgi:hypothetical protein
MIGRYHQQLKATSLAMLGALLLHVAGAVLHPFVHAAAGPDRTAQVAAVDGPSEAPSPAPAGEDVHENCAACTVARAVALQAPAAAGVTATLVPAITTLPEVVRERAPPRLESAQPRGPPHI